MSEELKEYFDDYYSRLQVDERIPDRMKESIDRYVYHRIPPGGFLEAVLSNDFKGAVGRADDTNIKYLKQYALYVCNCMPSTAQGSHEKVKAWLKGDDND